MQLSHWRTLPLLPPVLQGTHSNSPPEERTAVVPVQTDQQRALTKGVAVLDKVACLHDTDQAYGIGRLCTWK